VVAAGIAHSRKNASAIAIKPNVWSAQTLVTGFVFDLLLGVESSIAWRAVTPSRDGSH
jgi:hypothetical protein